MDDQKHYNCVIFTLINFREKTSISLYIGTLVNAIEYILSNEKPHDKMAD